MRTVEPIQPGDSGGDAPARIAIVEDDYLVAFAMEEALVEAGFDVVALASSAEEILDLASTARPTLAVMDIRLNGARDGIDAALELFAKHGIRSVFATAYQTREMRARAEPARPRGVGGGTATRYECGRHSAGLSRHRAWPQPEMGDRSRKARVFRWPKIASCGIRLPPNRRDHSQGRMKTSRRAAKRIRRPRFSVLLSHRG